MSKKILYKVNNNITIEIEGEKNSDVFSELARTQEIFSEPSCGVCNGEYKFVLRTAKDKKNKEFTYYELLCTNLNCRAKFFYGVGGDNVDLFPKRKWDSLSEEQQKNREEDQEYAEKHYGYLPHRGWYKYKGEK